jgi:hypothetical protein
MGRRVKSGGGSGISTPYVADFSQSPEGAFRATIIGLCPEHSFDDRVLKDLYYGFGAVVHKAVSEEEQPEILPLARRLDRFARELEDLAESLGGLQTGLHRSKDIEFARYVKEAMSLNPAVLDAEKELVGFQRQCSSMSHMLRVALKILQEEPGKAGRRKLDWYDDFTAFLLEVAKMADIKPSHKKHRVTGARSGWLFEAAQSLEQLLWPATRSRSPEACGKRLERSLRRLKDGNRQNRA